MAVQADDGQLFRILGPVDARQIDILLLAGIHFQGSAVVHIIYVYRHFGIFLAGFRIFICIVGRVEFVGFQCRALSFKHVHLEFAHFALVKFDIGEGGSVRCPFKGTVEGEFLFIHPVRRSVDDVVELAVRGDLTFRTETEVVDKEVVVADKGDAQTVR